ncbi:hypothetical protein EB74_27515 [Mycobacterium sp. SWH-M5]|nr:hypothetical protein EB74_27515 [Mycobacterium sp. SWH-M5]
MPDRPDLVSNGQFRSVQVSFSEDFAVGGDQVCHPARRAVLGLHRLPNAPEQRAAVVEAE